MTFANNAVVAKLSIAFVTAAMLLTMVAPAQAATEAEMQAQIATLMASIAALQAQLGQSTTPSASVSCTFTRSLTLGSQGADVTCLQNALIAWGGSIPAGATGYFGAQTAAAVAAWQTANGVSPAVGYFGPVSQAKFAAMAAVTPTPSDDDSDDDSSDDDSDSEELSGEASLFNMEIDSASDDQLEEGSEDAEVAMATFEFQDGDARITRLDVGFDSVSNTADVWDVLEEVAIFVDGEEVDRMDASDEDEYLDTTGNAGTLRFSGLDLVGMEDEELEVTIVATINGSVDSGDQGTFNVSVDAMRFEDADDVTDTITTGEDFDTNVTFEVDAAGVDDELIVKTSDSDPDGTTLELEDDSKSDWYNVFTFDLDTDDSVNDIELTTVVVHLAFSSSSYATLVDDAELVIDGVTIDSVTASSSASTTDLTFDVDGDVTIEAGDRVAAELMLKFKSLATLNEGVTVTGSLTAANRGLLEAEGADDLTSGQISGAATGDVHTLRTAGVNVTAGDMSAVVTPGDSSVDDYGTYVIELEVTAFNQDVYISTNPATSLTYVLEDSTGSTSISGTRSAVLTSSGDEVGSTFEITEGSTETLTLTVTYTPGVANTASRLNLNTLIFGSTSGAPTGQTWTASPDTDYRTDVKTMVN